MGTSMLGHALDEEAQLQQEEDTSQDLFDVVLGWEVVLSVGDAQLNVFRAFLHFNDYQEPKYYTDLFRNMDTLKDVCHGGGPGLQCAGGLGDRSVAKMSVERAHSVQPQIVFNIGRAMQELEAAGSTPTMDID